MKFANFVFSGKETHNLGDNLQLMAIDNLYKLMKIRQDEIVKIPYNQLATWKSLDGEKVILPINFPFLEYKDSGLSGMFSESIVPVFLGITILNSNISNEDIEFLKNHEPIGCRDEYTYNNLRRYGIQVWLNGCMTLTMFDKIPVESLNNREKVFIVDVCDELFEYIPQRLKENAVKLSQIVTLKNHEIVSDYVIQRYKMYFSEARLVITSRLHCAIPLISMGIPVILAVEKISFRFSWVEKLLPIYTPIDYGIINWNPTAIMQSENIKNLMILNAVNRIKGNPSDENSQLISSYWLSRSKSKYYIEGYDEAIECIKTLGSFDYVEYAFWGVTVLTKMINSYIKEHYSNATLVHVFDKYKNIEFDGHTTEWFDNFNPEKLQEIFVFITASAATNEAKVLFKKINKNTNFCLCYEHFVKSDL